MFHQQPNFNSEGMLINNECSSWYFNVSLGYEEEILYDNGLVGKVNQTTPLQSARSMAQSAMTIECEWFILLILTANQSTKLLTLTNTTYMYLYTSN